MSEVGHNSVSSVAADELRQFVERIERMDEEIKGLNSDKKDIYAEAKSRGFDTKAMKIIIQRRAKDASQREEEDAMVELYEQALEMAADQLKAKGKMKRGQKLAEVEDTPPARAPARESDDVDPFEGF